MDKFSSGKSGLHCTQTAMRLALAKKLPHPELRKQMFTEYLYLYRIWARPSRYGTKPFRPFLLLHCKCPPLMYSATPSPVFAKITTQNKPLYSKRGPSLMLRARKTYKGWSRQGSWCSPSEWPRRSEALSSSESGRAVPFPLQDLCSPCVCVLEY